MSIAFPPSTSPPVALPAISPRFREHGPFLRWPISRRDFFLTLTLAILPPIVWGCTIFGWRALLMFLAAQLAAALMHLLLARLTHRGKLLLYAHTLVATTLMVGLCKPTWPLLIVASAGALLPIVLWILGGPGRERILVSGVMVLLIQFVLYLQTGHIGGIGTRGAPAPPEAILAQDRLFSGDVLNTSHIPFYEWPHMLELTGNDAVVFPRPERSVSDAFNNFSLTLRQMPVRPATTVIDLGTRQLLTNNLDSVFSDKLPPFEWMFLGIFPGRIAAISLPALVLGGLYLAYRYLLRLWSLLTFAIAHVVAFLFSLITPLAIAHVGAWGLIGVWRTFPAEFLTLSAYSLINSDLVFAAVLLLALPGSEPLTSRGRRIFLVLAGVLSAALARAGLDLPAATITLCLMMPFIPAFDAAFGKRSWLTRRG